MQQLLKPSRRPIGKPTQGRHNGDPLPTERRADELLTAKSRVETKSRVDTTFVGPHVTGQPVLNHQVSTTSSNWRDQANCHGRIELFFAKRAERPEARARREAKALTLCNQCTVSAQCRDFARQHHEYGFWAGESEEDRHVLGFTVSAPIGTRARRNDPIPRSGKAG